MRSSTHLLALTTACALLLGLAHGSMEGDNRLYIDFTKAEDAKTKATWGAKPDKVNLTEGGLGYDSQPGSSIDGWILTQPLAVGYSWRPTSHVQIRVTIAPPPQPIVQANGQSYTPFGGRVYARFSPDLKHWSTWQVLEATYPLPADAPGRLFTGSLGVPGRERREYLEQCQAYAKLDVPWADDEEACVAWILQQDPKFFERSLPFVGYVEFLYEDQFHSGQRISSFNAQVGYGMSGLMRPSKNPEVMRERMLSPWRFKAP